MERRKVLFLPSWYPSRVNPTNGNFIRSYAETISSFADTDVLFVISDNSTKDIELIQSSNEKKTVRETIIYYSKTSTSLLSGLFKIWKYLKLLSLGYNKIYHKNHHPDLVHVQVTFPAGLFALWLKKKKGISYIVTEHWSGYYPEDGRYRGLLMKYFTRKIIENASCVTTVSSSLAQEMKNHGLNADYTVISNVVNTSIFKPSNNILSKDMKQLIHISGLDPEKNMDGILHVIAKLSEKRNDFQLLVVCDSDNKERYAALASELNLLNTFVFFTGRKEPDEIAELFNQSVALVMFSKFETMSIVMAEAWACGKPVITTKVGGVTEYVNDSRGRLVSSGNEKELEYEINWMLDNFNSYQMDDIRKYAVENFSSEIIASKFESVYNNIHSKFFIR